MSVYSTVQGKVGFHVRGGMQALLPLAHALEHIGGQIVVLELIDAVFNELAQVKSLGPPRLGRKEAEPLLGFRGQPDRGRQEMSPACREYVYS